MHAHTTGLLAAALGLTSFAPAPLPKEPKEAGPATLAALQGTWSIVSVSSFEAGKLAEAKFPYECEVTVARDHWSATLKDKRPQRMTIRLDTSKAPTRMDLTYQDRPMTIQGVVRRVGDELEFCYARPVAGNPRPTRFPPSEDGQLLMKLRRKGP